VSKRRPGDSVVSCRGKCGSFAIGMSMISEANRALNPTSRSGNALRGKA
jgi:hypothetical protein